MCLAVFALGAHPRYRVVIAANRDEFHARPTATARWWDEGWLGGRDLEAGGTWLGVTREARWALLTNVREPATNDPRAPTRGTLVPQVLAADRSAVNAIPAIVAAHGRCNGFNLVGGDHDLSAWANHRVGHANVTRRLPPGLHGLSNHLLDTPWPKVVRIKAAVGAWCASAASDFEPLFSALGDRTEAPEAELPSTGIRIELERLLSAPFIISENYGTRSSTVVALDHDGAARFVERSFDSAGRLTAVADFSFTLCDPSPPEARP